MKFYMNHRVTGKSIYVDDSNNYYYFENNRYILIQEDEEIKQRIKLLREHGISIELSNEQINKIKNYN